MPLSTATTTAYAYCHWLCRTPESMADPGRHRPPWLVPEVLGTVRLPDGFLGALSDRFQLTSPNGTPLSADLRKGGGITHSWAASRMRHPPSHGSQSSRSWGSTRTEEHTLFTCSSLSQLVSLTPTEGCLDVAGNSRLRDSRILPRS